MLASAKSAYKISKSPKINQDNKDILVALMHTPNVQNKKVNINRFIHEHDNKYSNKEPKFTNFLKQSNFNSEK